MKTRQLTLCALLTAAALALSYLEGLLPPVVPLPGVKLGLGNVVTVFALYTLGAAPAGLVLLGRCLLGSAFAGNAGALLYSLLGGGAAWCVMAALKKSPCSVYGVSVAGAAAHGAGQAAAACVMLRSWAAVSYLPVLLAAALFTGTATAAAAAAVLRLWQRRAGAEPSGPLG